MSVSLPCVTWCTSLSYNHVCLCTKCHLLPKTQIYWCLSLYKVSRTAQHAALLMSLCTNCDLMHETQLYCCLSLYQVSLDAQISAILISVSVPSVTYCLKRSYIEVCLCTKCHMLPRTQLYWCLSLCTNCHLLCKTQLYWCLSLYQLSLAA